MMMVSSASLGAPYHGIIRFPATGYVEVEMKGLMWKELRIEMKKVDERMNGRARVWKR